MFLTNAVVEALLLDTFDARCIWPNGPLPQSILIVHWGNEKATQQYIIEDADKCTLDLLKVRILVVRHDLFFSIMLGGCKADVRRL
jgi:hypothetical protein